MYIDMQAGHREAAAEEKEKKKGRPKSARGHFLKATMYFSLAFASACAGSAGAMVASESAGLGVLLSLAGFVGCFTFMPMWAMSYVEGLSYSYAAKDRFGFAKWVEDYNDKRDARKKEEQEEKKSEDKEPVAEKTEKTEGGKDNETGQQTPEPVVVVPAGVVTPPQELPVDKRARERSPALATPDYFNKPIF